MRLCNVISDLHITVKIYRLSNEQCCCSEGRVWICHIRSVFAFSLTSSSTCLFRVPFLIPLSRYSSRLSFRISRHCEVEQCNCWTRPSLTAEAWHHFLKINHDIIAEADTAPLAWLCLHGAGSSWSCDICALGSCWFAYKVREDSASPPSSPICRKSPHFSLPCTPSTAILLMEAQIILPLSLPFPLHLSRPVLLTHQRQCTAYSLPACCCHGNRCGCLWQWEASMQGKR